jgi:hypothetical protein
MRTGCGAGRRDAVCRAHQHTPHAQCLQCLYNIVTHLVTYVPHLFETRQDAAEDLAAWLDVDESKSLGVNEGGKDAPPPGVKLDFAQVGRLICHAGH